MKLWLAARNLPNVAVLGVSRRSREPGGADKASSDRGR